MFRKMLVASVCLVGSLILVVTGCSDSSLRSINPPGEENPTGGTGQKFLGLVEITISGIGSSKMAASAHSVMPLVAANMTHLPTSGGTDGTIQYKPISHGSFTIGERPPNGQGYRYFYATFKIRNADHDGDPYQSALNNLTFLAVDVGNGKTYGQTAVSTLRVYDGTLLKGQDAVALAKKIVPTGRVTHIPTDPDGLRVVTVDVLQVLTESEASNVEAGLPSGSAVIDVFPYGFVVRTPDVTPNSRTLPDLTSDGRSGTGQFDGIVTFAFKIPLQSHANQDPFEISIMFIAVEDSQTRITQSIQANATDVLNEFAARASEINADMVTLFPQGSYSGPIPTRTLCLVRVAGPKNNPATVIGSNCNPAGLMTWTGKVSTAWGNANNWDPSLVPTSASAVLIPNGVPNAPILSMDATVKSLTIKGTKLTIKGHTLTIKGQ